MAATTEPTADTPSTEVEQVISTAIEKVGKVASLADLMALLALPEQSAVQPARIPTAKAITPAQQAAVARLPEVFGRVVPTERRALQPVEVTALVDEKITLDDVKKMAEARLKDVTATIHNHLDVEYEAATPEAERTIRDDNGHYIVEGRSGAEDREKEFSRETRQGSSVLNVEALKALDTGEPDALLTHAEFLAMTRQVRIVDEARVLDVIRNKPALVRALNAAIEPGKSGTSVYLRAKK